MKQPLASTSSPAKETPSFSIRTSDAAARVDEAAPYQHVNAHKEPPASFIMISDAAGRVHEAAPYLHAVTSSPMKETLASSITILDVAGRVDAYQHVINCKRNSILLNHNLRRSRQGRWSSPLRKKNSILLQMK
jgi:hypothetical protein